MRLAARRAVVTGASSGIGRAIAVALANEGVSVCLSGRDKERLEGAQSACRGRGVARTVAIARDVTQPGGTEALAAEAQGAFGAIDILVHSAGLYASGRHAETTDAAFRAQLEGNLVAPWRLTQLLLPTLRDLVFVNSTQGLAAPPGAGHFAATQHALKAVADSLREEMNAAGLRVLTLHLGRTATPRQAKIFATEGRDYTPERLMQPEDVAAVVIAALALPRTAEMTTVTIRPMQKP